MKPTTPDWIEARVRDARTALDRLDHTLTLAEAKDVLARLLLARRREREGAECPTCNA
jgi:hypothetical protein